MGGNPGLVRARVGVLRGGPGPGASTPPCGVSEVVCEALLPTALPPPSLSPRSVYLSPRHCPTPRPIRSSRRPPGCITPSGLWMCSWFRCGGEGAGGGGAERGRLRLECASAPLIPLLLSIRVPYSIALPLPVPFIKIETIFFECKNSKTSKIEQYDSYDDLTC